MAGPVFAVGDKVRRKHGPRTDMVGTVIALGLGFDPNDSEYVQVLWPETLAGELVYRLRGELRRGRRDTHQIKRLVLVATSS